MKSCFLIGHRDASESLYPLIVNEIERHIIEYNVNEFIAGQYGQFDRMTARATRALKARNPAVRLVLLLPYLRNEHCPRDLMNPSTRMDLNVCLNGLLYRGPTKPWLTDAII